MISDETNNRKKQTATFRGIISRQPCTISQIALAMAVSIRACRWKPRCDQSTSPRDDAARVLVSLLLEMPVRKFQARRHVSWPRNSYRRSVSFGQASRGSTASRGSPVSRRSPPNGADCILAWNFKRATLCDLCGVKCHSRRQLRHLRFRSGSDKKFHKQPRRQQSFGLARNSLNFAVALLCLLSALKLRQRGGRPGSAEKTSAKLGSNEEFI